MQHLGLKDLGNSLRNQVSYRPPQPHATDSRIDLCYAHRTQVEVTRAQYQHLPSKAIGHRPLEAQLKVLQVPPAPSDSMDQDAQPHIRPPGEHNTPKWLAYYRSVGNILGHQSDPDLNLAMRQAAAACGLH